MKKTKKTALEVAKQLNDLINGLEKYSDLTELQSNLSIEEINGRLKALQNLEKEYRNTLNNARILYKELTSKLHEDIGYLSSSNRIIRAKLGTKDQRIVDFGLKPYKQTGKSKKRQNPSDSSTEQSTNP